MGEINYSVKFKNKAFPKQVTIQKLLLCKFYAKVKTSVCRFLWKTFNFCQKFFSRKELLYFTLFIFEKGYIKSTKKTNKYMEKTFKNLEKSWKNHGILFVSCSGNPEFLFEHWPLSTFPDRRCTSVRSVSHLNNF